METISSFLTQDHRDCDEDFAILENAVVQKDWAKAKDLYEKYVAHMRLHFDMEEKVMFPVFEQNTGMSCGPTQVMKMEHAQMNQLMDQMSEDLQKEDADHFLGLSETLMMLMQQHNMKEEQMLYAMADAHLTAQREDILTNMKAL